MLKQDEQEEGRAEPITLEEATGGQTRPVQSRIRHGYGELFDQEGNLLYLGHFIDNQYEGFGWLKYPGGSSYQGYF